MLTSSQGTADGFSSRTILSITNGFILSLAVGVCQNCASSTFIVQFWPVFSSLFAALRGTAKSEEKTGPELDYDFYCNPNITKLLYSFSSFVIREFRLQRAPDI